jgi:sortase B
MVMRKLIRILESTADLAVLILILAALLFGGYSLWDAGLIADAAETEQYEIYKPSAGESASFEELKALNPEVVAWLTVDGTGIDYPVVQGSGNNDYVNRDAKGEYSLSGALFLDYRNHAQFSDFNSLIFGHHMENSEMFGDIGKFENQEFFNTHRYGALFYNGAMHGIDFFEFLKADAYDDRIYAVPAVSEEGRRKYLSDLMNLAVYRRNTVVSADDHIVLLSTCSGSSTNGRDILAGIITDTVQH